MTETATESARPWDEKSIVKSLFKALAVLECYSPDSPALTVAELAARTGVQKATCNRLVTTMVYAGWLAPVGQSRFAPTIKLFRIGATAADRLDVRTIGRPLLERLAERFGDTGYLFVPDGPRVVCLDLVKGHHPLQLDHLKVGMSMPFNVGAAPLAILAHRPDLQAEVEMEALPKFTDRSVTDRAELRARLEAAREDGYVLSREDYAHDVAAIGAPVFDREGKAVAALSLGGIASGFVSPRLEEIVTAVREAAAELSAQLGHDGQPA